MPTREELISSSNEEETSSLRVSGKGSVEKGYGRALTRYGSVGASQTAVVEGRQGSEVGSIAMVSRGGQGERQRASRGQAAQLRSKSMSWKDPMMYLQSLGSRRVPTFVQSKATKGYRPQPKSSSQRKESSPERKKPSAWARLLKKLGLDGGKKVHAARADWLNYDAESYAMNFEKDKESQYSSNSQQMPKISGPGAREIVVALLQRSSSANRNSGSFLIPKPVLQNAVKAGLSTPLWQRRSVNAPSSLDLHRSRQSTSSRARRSIAA